MDMPLFVRLGFALAGWSALAWLNPLVTLALLAGRASRVIEIEPLRGVGDLVAVITASLFISSTGNCGCAKRRERWNQRWPLRVVSGVVIIALALVLWALALVLFLKEMLS